MKRLTLVLFLIVFGVEASAQTGWWGPQSKVVTDTLYSEVLNANREYTIFLPKSYETQTNREYPVLYLLHGMSGVNTSWFENEHAREIADQLIASGEACEMIIVSPNAGGNLAEGAWNGYFNMPGWPYETFFFTEFLPFIEKTYRIVCN